MSAAIRIAKLGKVYASGLTALEDVNLEVGVGEVVALVGASGCGKSTLLRIIAGLERDFAGTVEVGGERMRGPGLDRGIVFQEHRLLPWLTVAENVGFGVASLPPKERRRTVTEHVGLVGLEGFEGAYPHELSGGMAQRVAIARALAPRPSVLLLDEPFGALDAFTRIQLQEEVRRIRGVEGTTLMLVTHDIDEAVFLADRVVILGSRPGTVRQIVDVRLPHTRDRTSSDFAHLRRIIYREFFKSEDGSPEYAI